MAELVLEPEQGVSVRSGRFHADALPAWLRLVNFDEVCGRNWFFIRYASSFFDRPVRPLIAFRTRSDRVFTYIMNGPVAGTAEWIGRVPDNTVAVSMCTTDRLGPFDFRIEAARPVSRFELVGRNIAAGVPRTRRLMKSRMSDARQFEIDLSKIVNSGTPMSRYAEWLRRFRRSPELHGIDRPRREWGQGPRFALYLALGPSARPKTIAATVRSLQDQFYHRWSLHACVEAGAPERALRAYRQLAAQDRRLGEIESGLPLFSAAAEQADWFAAIAPGDTLSSLALGCIVEEIAADPSIRLLYSDEDAVTEAGRIHSPLLKPDWSPHFQAAADYVGGLTVVRSDALAGAGLSRPEQLSTDDTALRTVLATLPGKEILHLRRILYRRSSERPFSSPRMSAATTDLPAATIVVVTRDRADLLRSCLRGLREMTDYPDFDAVVVDNGTVDGDALTILASLKDDPRFTVIEQPGPFNYSALCNAGAGKSTSPLLVFLNNDVEMCDRNWLKALAQAAMRPQTGVAGAKLLFPNGRIQHAGVTLGIGTVSGHLYSNTPGDDPGYMRQLVSDREVSAVTGACCAIAREKFEALGGFDETNLPVEFSDIDLCLRARERGWSNICVAGAVLIHRESETRGEAPPKTYDAERDYFLRRWPHVIRDDPYFHPALSLFSLYPALA